MKTETLKLPVSDSAGAVSAEYIIPAKSKCILMLAHGAGAGMDHPFMITLAKSLAEKNIATLRFNFPFIERKGRPDVPAVAHKTIEQQSLLPIKNFLNFHFLFQANLLGDG